jgi:hypothetical protein
VRGLPRAPETQRHRGKEPTMIEARRRLSVCQMRSQTDLPCGRPAAVTVLGVPLRDRCALEQDGWFAVGELTQVPRGREPREAVAAIRTPQTHSPRAGGIGRLLRQRASGGKVVPLLAIIAVAVSVFAAAACGGPSRRALVAHPPNQRGGRRQKTKTARRPRKRAPEATVTTRSLRRRVTLRSARTAPGRGREMPRPASAGPQHRRATCGSRATG